MNIWQPQKAGREPDERFSENSGSENRQCRVGNRSMLSACALLNDAIPVKFQSALPDSRDCGTKAGAQIGK